MRRNDKLARSRRLKRPESVLDLCNEMNATTFTRSSGLRATAQAGNIQSWGLRTAYHTCSTQPRALHINVAADFRSIPRHSGLDHEG
jgi:hypothetical protein